MTKSGTESYDHILKLLLIGDSAVGKSSILIQFTDDAFDEDIGTTIGVDFKVKYLNVFQKRVKLTIWDTAGQERFRTLTSSYYRGAQGVIMVYDVTNKESFLNLNNWIKEVDSYATYEDHIKLLVGNKIDLADQRQVTKQMGEKFARDHNMVFIECSAKTRVGVEQTFEEIARKILETDSLLDNSAPVRLGDSENAVSLQGEEEEEKESSGLCC
ncbi:Ras-related protein Rab [Acrasis kona]|uniref:Ras-related protein Rab n=1 Tax=Acrasis kona TaxID=1008807 RepID=A0AAW2YJL6_9EUKA